MAGTLQELKNWLVKDKKFKKMLADKDYDVVLAERDCPPFDPEWVRVDDIVKSTKRDDRLSDDEWKLIDEIRYLAFTQTGEFAGHHEICRYVSDDFGLIATALASGCEDSWLNALWASYKHGKIPCGELAPVNGSLRALI